MTPEATDTPHLTPTLLPTGTPVPPTPASSEPTPTTAQILEPTILRLRGAGAQLAVVDTHGPVTTQWSWRVGDPGALQDSLEAVTLELSLDGSAAAIGPLAGYRREGRGEDRRGGFQAWAVDRSSQFAAFASGTSHSLEVKGNFSCTLIDGCDADGDDQLDMYGPGRWPSEGRRSAYSDETTQYWH